MIHVRGDLAATIAQFRALAAQLAPDIDAAIDAALTEVIARLEPATPVRTGRMRAGYRHQQIAPGYWELSDEPYYSRFVIGGTRYITPNQALNQVLDDAETLLTEALDVAVRRLVKP